MKKKIDLISGARPNFMKIAPIFKVLSKNPKLSPRIIHTGQHYSDDMWKVFMRDFELNEPHANLNAVTPDQKLDRMAQIQLIQRLYQDQIQKDRPEFIVVVGDVNSTLAAARVGRAARIPIGHVESGLRSRDLEMPEELNRIETDQISNILWTPSRDGDDNLRQEGVKGKVEFVGNIMIDAYLSLKKYIDKEALKLGQSNHAVVTFHRPENVDSVERLSILVQFLNSLSERIEVSFPIHPRTRERLRQFKLLSILSDNPRIHLKEPLNYIGFMAEVSRAKFTVTDSGGIQEETTFLKIPCLTVRKNTERPITITEGSNKLFKPEDIPTGILEDVDNILSGKWKIQCGIPELWDGQTADRIAASIERSLFGY